MPHIMKMNKEVMHFKLRYNFVWWQCSATCHQDITAQAHWLGISDFSISTIFPWSLSYWLPFFPAYGSFFTPKTFRSKGEVETAFKDFLAWKSSEFYRIGINNLANQWQKCLNIQESYFDCLNSLNQFSNRKFILKSKDKDRERRKEKSIICFLSHNSLTPTAIIWNI